jgi:hypothetical protein
MAKAKAGMSGENLKSVHAAYNGNQSENNVASAFCRKYPSGNVAGVKNNESERK